MEEEEEDEGKEEEGEGRVRVLLQLLPSILTQEWSTHKNMTPGFGEKIRIIQTLVCSARKKNILIISINILVKNVKELK